MKKPVVHPRHLQYFKDKYSTDNNRRYAKSHRFCKRMYKKSWRCIMKNKLKSELCQNIT